ncbi:TIGR03960 family B12-binding radical SAM protein [Desulfolucanica intricata]|uniref:TIGR03960 family B12-binding radical SAM protein n=1 Tax=Desulfolucanica intricata TaxID=1285191 RepID=UPI00083016A1|nr:TIGR03960 family B12-binding radical SAM protein [Desulfolucanica intricata]
MQSPLLEKILKKVEKPARYVGGEWNSIQKNWDEVAVKMAFAFPDVYEVGMSHLGLQIMYHVINSREDALMERVFAPWIDMEEQLRQNQVSLFSLESHRPLRDFDFIGFTLQYEMSFTNILNMIDLSQIPIRSKDRGGQDPFVIAGGPCAYNPEPLADFIDLFVIGEGEDVTGELLDLYLDWRNKKETRQDFLMRAAQIEGIYVPSLYRVNYREDGSILAIDPVEEGVFKRVTKRLLSDFDQAPFPTSPIVPYLGVVHDRMMLEVFRGCTRGCRFCQAGIIYRPVREKSPETLLKQAEELVQNTGHDEISLTSLSTADYSQVRTVISELLNRYASKGINISLPSLRVDAFSIEMAKEVQKVRKSGLTFAPEAGTQRLRDVINKGVTEEDLINAVSGAFEAGWSSVKLYFMIGLPTETDEDLDGIARLAHKVVEIGTEKKVPRNRLKVTVSASSFVPKAHSAFQWEPQDRLEELKRKQDYLKSKLRGRQIVFNWHEPEVSFMEAVFSRGDRRLGAALEEAWRLGCRFDGWSECFKYDKWLEAFSRTGLDPKWYAYRRFKYSDVLPWEHINPGVTKKYLEREHKQAMAGHLTCDCRKEKCPGCGLCPSLDVKIELHGGEDNAPL